MLALIAAAALAGPLPGKTAPAPPADPTPWRPASGPARRHRRPRLRFEIPPEHLVALRAFLKEHLPDALAQMERLQEENPRQARRQLLRLYRLWWRVRDYPADVRKAAIGRQRLGRYIYRTVREIRQAASPGEKAVLTKKLRRLLGEHFDLDMIVKEHQVKLLAGRLAELKARVEQRRKNRKAVIEERLARLLHPPATQPTATRPGPHRRWSARRPIGPRREAELIRFLKESAPELLSQLQRLKKDDPAEARRMLGRLNGLWRRVRGYPPQVRAAAIGRRRLNVAVESTVRRLAGAVEPRQRAMLTRKLRGLLAEQFDYGQVVDEYHLGRLVRQLGELKARIALRRRRRSEIIADWVDRLLQPPVASRPAEAAASTSR